MVVYRLENIFSGKGPHNDNSWYCLPIKDDIKEYLSLQDELYNFDQYPTIHDSWPCGFYSRNKYNKNFICACENVKKLFHWFSPEIIVYLQDASFYIAKYEVNEKGVKKGKFGKQLFFNVKQAFKIGYYDIDDLDNKLDI